MDILRLLNETAAPLGIAVVALLMLREEGRRNAQALQTILSEHIETTRAIVRQMATLAELIRSSHTHNKE